LTRPFEIGELVRVAACELLQVAHDRIDPRNPVDRRRQQVVDVVEQGGR
jgi:hypothetical protein